MNFSEALIVLKAGERITRNSYMWDGYFLALVQDEGESIQLFDKKGWVDCERSVSHSDLLAEDWEIVASGDEEL